MVNRITVHLIRHEKTQANIERKYIGWTDEPIIEEATAISNLQPQTVHGSDLMRCQQTANSYFPGATFIANAQLRELHFGDFEMKTYDELQHNHIYRAWIDDPMTVAPPNGESFIQFQQRVVQAFQAIVTAEQSYTFVVHGGVIRVLLALYGMAEKSFQQVMANHQTIYTLQWDSLSEVKGGARCTSYSEEPIMANGHM